MNEEQQNNTVPQPFEPKGGTTTTPIPPISQLLKDSWQEYKKRPWQYSGAILGGIVLIFLYYFIIELASYGLGIAPTGVFSTSLPYVILQIIGIVAESWFLAGMTVVIMRQLTRGASSLKDLWYTPLHVPLTGLFIILNLAVMGGVILLIIPGIIWSIRLMFSDYVLIDSDGKASLMASFNKSASITYGRFWKLFWYSIIIGFVGISGILLFVVGLLVTAPLAFIAHILLYKSIKHVDTTNAKNQSLVVKHLWTILLIGSIIGTFVAVADIATQDDEMWHDDEMLEHELEHELEGDHEFGLESIA